MSPLIWNAIRVNTYGEKQPFSIIATISPKYYASQKKHNIKIVLTTLASNLKDFSPLIRNDDLNEAIAQLKMAIEINPKLAKAHNNLAIAYHTTGK